MPGNSQSSAEVLEAQRSVERRAAQLRSMPSRGVDRAAFTHSRPGDPGQVALLAAMCRKSVRAELPVDYRAWMELFDGFNIVCASGSPMQIHGVASASLLYDGQGTLEPEFLEIGTDNGGWLYTVDLLNSWGKCAGSIWIVPMSAPDEPFFCAPSLSAAVDCLAQGVDFIQRGYDDRSFRLMT